MSKPKPKPKTFEDFQANPDFENLLNLLAIFSEASSRNAILQGELNQEHITLIDEHKGDYAVNQSAISETEEGIRAIVKRNPKWFEASKTLKTPYGVVKSTSGKKLNIPSEDATMRLIRAADRGTEFIRTKDELDKEALEKLEDHDLAAFGIIRETTETITIKPAAVTLGQAVKEGEEE